MSGLPAQLEQGVLVPDDSIHLLGLLLNVDSVLRQVSHCGSNISMAAAESTGSLLWVWSLCPTVPSKVPQGLIAPDWVTYSAWSNEYGLGHIVD